MAAILLFLFVIFITLSIVLVIRYKNTIEEKKYNTTQAPTKVTELYSTTTSTHDQTYRPVIHHYTNTSIKEAVNGDEIKTIITKAIVSTTGKTRINGSNGKSDVVPIRSIKDNKTYFVASDLPDKDKAVDLLYEINRRGQYLLQSIDEQLDGNRRIVYDGVDITDNMKTLVRKHYKKDVPLVEYHSPHDMTVGSNSDKGTMIETCLRSKYNTKEWNSINTLMRVHCHELAHSSDFQFRGDGEDAHGPVFMRLHKFLLGVSENLGLYNCVEYTASNQAFCGVRLTETYCGSI
jgi:hypothetical protein